MRRYGKEIAERALKTATEQINEFEKTKRKSLLDMAYANIGFATWHGLNTKEQIRRLKKYGKGVKNIKEWEPSR